MSEAQEQHVDRPGSEAPASAKSLGAVEDNGPLPRPGSEPSQTSADPTSQRSRRRREHEFALLDPVAKREIRRASLKAVCIPGYQVPFASRELPIARGFGTGGLQLTLSLIGPTDTLKVIDQGADASVNACSLRKLVRKVCPGVKTSEITSDATLIQTRHRIPEEPLTDRQVLVFQVPYPCPLVLVESNEQRRVQMHGESDYSKIFVKLYEDLARFQEITLSHRYPTAIHRHYVIDPSPIPRFDVPKLDHARCLHLFGAGREKKIYAVPPFTDAKPLEFDDIRFRVESFDVAGQRQACQRCGSAESYLNELIRPDGSRVWVCSDTAFCQRSRT
ncbi:MAG: alpha-D-ribose 1-methylphosphonate 5-phosphate C-P-lyase PhnJ [Planctomycetota bacterium]